MAVGDVIAGAALEVQVGLNAAALTGPVTPPILGVLRPAGYWGIVVKGEGSNQADLLLWAPGAAANEEIVQLVANGSGDFAIRSITDAGAAKATLFKADMTDGRTSIGGDPVASALLALTSTAGALLIPRMTEAQRDALTAADGMLVYNTTAGVINAREGGAWVDL